ncbi:MAG: THUMP domain-containing protein [Myxococcota bacterium]
MTELVLTTNPGVEDVVITELREVAQAAGVSVGAAEAGYRKRRGVVRVELGATPRECAALARSMRSIHHILRPLLQFTLDPEDPLGDMRRRLAVLPIAELDDAATFRVTGVRKGRHDFTSIDVQKAAGAGIVDGTRKGVSMKDFDVEIRVEVEDQRCDVGVQLTRKAISRRRWRPYRAKTALKANVAYAMLRLALDGQPSPRRLLDPFCGSGTLLIEAAERFPDTALVGVELYDKPFKGAQENLTALELTEQVTVHQADGRQLRVLFPEGRATVDAIISNPPFGVRLGQKLDFDVFYDGLLSDAAFLLRAGGRLAALVWHRGAFNRAMRRRGKQMASVHVRIIETGNIYPGLFILERLPRASDEA